MSGRISQLRNLGPATERRLAEVGIETEAEFRAIGAEEAWHRLRFAFGKEVTTVALYALEAALLGCDWRALPVEEKARLRELARRQR